MAERGIRRLVQVIVDKASARKVKRQISKALDEGTDTKKAKKNVEGLRQSLLRLGGVIASVFAVRKLVDFTKAIFTLGTAAEETASKFTTVFGEAGDELDEFIETFGQLAGLTRTEGREFAATAGAIAQGMGLAVAESADFSRAILRLAGDLSSFNNVPIGETFAAIRSGITGEAEPLKRFGIVLLDAEVKARALTETGKKLTAELTLQEIALARLTLIYEKAGVAAGDLERTQDSTANTARRLSTQWRQMKEDVAVGLLPVLSVFINSWTEVSGAMSIAGNVARTVGGVITKVVVGLQIISVRLNAFFRTIPAQFRVSISQELDLLADWAEVAERLVNRVRGVFGADAVDFTSGLRDSAARLRSEGIADIQAFRILVEEEIAKIVRAASVVAGTPSGGGGGAPAPTGGGGGLEIGNVERRDLAGQLTSQFQIAGDAATVFSLKATSAMQMVGREADMAALSVSGIGFALANEGLEGLARFAAGKAKENVAFAIEQAARGFGALAGGNAASATLFFKSSAEHVAAAAAWGVFGGGGSGGGGLGAGADRTSGRASQVVTLPPEINIFVDGVNPDNARHQDLIHRTAKLAQERHGDQIPNIRVNPASARMP